MMKNNKNEEHSEHHFIVKYSEHEGWSWDTDTEEARFRGSIYLPKLQKWVNSSYSNDINRIDTEASNQLGRAISVMNGDM